MQQWYEISEDHWSEIVYNYHFKGRAPVLLKEHTYAIHFLTVITRLSDVPQFLHFHLLSLLFSLQVGSEAAQLKEYMVGPVSLQAEHFSSLSIQIHREYTNVNKWQTE